MAQSSAGAAIHSGISMVSYPPPVPDTAAYIDFSEMNDSCNAWTGLCPAPIPDVWIRGDSIFSSYGIKPDSALTAEVVRLQSYLAALSNPTAVSAAFDSLFDSLCVAAPAKAWSRSAHLGIGAFFVKTGEGKYACLVIYDRYVGGLDRWYFYRAYQDDGTRWLYKGIGPVAKWDSVLVIPHFFSGRPDPVFVLRDSADVTQVRLAVIRLAQTAAQNGVPLMGGYPVWGSLEVVYGQPSFSSMWYAPVDAARDSVAVQLSQTDVRMVPDSAGSFEAMILGMLIRENPVSIIGTDTIDAKAFIKLMTQVSPVVTLRPIGEKALQKTYGRVRYLPQHRTLEAAIECPQHVSVAVFDCLGRRTRVLYGGMVQKGFWRLTVPKSGVGAVRFILVDIGGVQSVFADAQPKE